MQKVTVKLGKRIYEGRTWKRRDVIYCDSVKIGLIHLSEHDRMGATTCLASSEKRDGRQVSWCVAESIRRHVVAPIDFLLFRQPTHKVAAL